MSIHKLDIIIKLYKFMHKNKYYHKQIKKLCKIDKNI